VLGGRNILGTCLLKKYRAKIMIMIIIMYYTFHIIYVIIYIKEENCDCDDG
jgi:hypothetical protein